MFSGSYNPVRHDGWVGSYRLGEDTAAQNGDDPSQPIGAYFSMAQKWVPMQAVLEGNQFLKQVARDYIPMLPNESDACYDRRLKAALFSPYTSRVIEGAIGLILRKPITLEGGNEQWWEDWSMDVDRQGTDLMEFARRLLRIAIGYGHCGVMCDYPKADGIRTLADERAARLTPYLNVVEPWNIIGWKHDPKESGGQITQMRIREMVSEDLGEFGQKIVEQIRVLEPGNYRVYRKERGDARWELKEAGRTSLDRIPVSVTYSDKQAVLISRPPLLDVAHINLAHYRLQSQHLNSLQVAGFPLLVLKGWDDQAPELQVDVSKALAMPTDGDVSYVEPANAAFDAYQTELEQLETQMSNLGIAILAQQKNVAEAAKKAALDRADTNSMLANISQDLQDALQEAVDMAAEYAGQPAPTVGLSRDFDVARMDSGEVSGVVQLFSAGIIDQQTALEMLHKGEVLDDSVDVEEIMSSTENAELHDIEMQVERTEAMAKIGEGTPEETDAGKIKKPDAEG